MITHLISTTEFIKLINSEEFIDKYDNDIKYTIELAKKYVSFISQKPELWMFVPVDEECNVLEEPVYTNRDNLYYNEEYYNKYQQAQSKVLFKDWKYNYERKMIRNIKDTCGFILPWDNTIEELMNRNFELELTEKALTELGL